MPKGYVNIPRKVRVGAQTFTVYTDRPLLDFGSIDFQTLNIQIDSLAAPSRQGQTFVHELVAAINKEYHVDLTHGQIEQLECALYQVVVDNPTIFKEAY